NSAEDHVWNEYFDTRWIHWDGGRENPLMYERNWGKTISTVWSWRGDGLTWSVVDRYSEGVCTIKGNVQDQLGRPVEGADVLLATENFYDPSYLTITHWAGTDPDGNYITTAGDERNYWAQADGGNLGKDPGGSTVKQIVTGSADGGVYTGNFKLPGSSNYLRVEDTPVPSDQDARYLMKVDLNVTSSLVHGQNLYTGERYDRFHDYGYIDFFLADSSNFDMFHNNRNSRGYGVAEGESSIDLEMPLVKEDIYFGVISNGFSKMAMKTVNVTVTVQSYLDIEIEGPESGTSFTLGDTVTVYGTSFSPWGMKDLKVGFKGREFLQAVDTSSQGDPVYSEWEARLETFDAGPGSHILVVKGTDGERTLEVESEIEIKDTEEPSVDILLPVENQRFRKDSVLTFSGTCSDDHRVERLGYYIDERILGEWDVTPHLEGGNWSFDLDLVEVDVGLHFLHVFGSDPSGNEGSDSVEFEVTEIEAPLIRFTGPVNNSLIRNEGLLQLEGEASDGSGLRSFSLSVDGGERESIRSAIENDGTFEYLLDTTGLEDGPHVFSIMGEDYFGNIAWDSVHLILDGTRPVFDIPESYQGMVFRMEEGISIQGWINDTNGIGELWVHVHRGESYNITDTLEDGRFTAELDDLYSLPSKDLTLFFTGVDLAGWETSAEVELICDSETPNVILTLPEILEQGNGCIVGVRIIEDTGLSSILLTTFSGEVIDLTDSISGTSYELDIDTSAVGAGSHNISIIVLDLAGRESSDRGSVYIYDGISDQDGDLMPDRWEVEYGLDPFRHDSGEDPDRDGFSNLEEYLGIDGKPGTDDHTDPMKETSFPVEQEEDGKDTFLLVLIIAVFGVVVLLVGLVGIVIYRSKLGTPPPVVPFPATMTLPQKPPQTLPRQVVPDQLPPPPRPPSQ
ncbi:MAG: Ig-like domain-containing protein, partial [Thermoplasmatota archaeon]